jgi:flap endonuclease-1
MGTNLKDLAVKKEITLDELKNKKLVVDSFNVLYQFLSTIRARDGSLLTDSEGNVTSHLVGLFSRTTKLMQEGLQLAFVFDGKPPKLKQLEREKRKEAKVKAQVEYELAVQDEDVDAMKKFASRTSVLTKDMVVEAKKLVEALGLPIIQAPSEGEAQAAYMVKNKDAWAEVSQDYDCMVFGVPRLIRNLTLSEKKKMPGRHQYQKVLPESIELNPTLTKLGISHEQLMVLSIIVGTDFNPGGVKGLGPKKALKLVKEYKDDYDALFKKIEWKNFFEHDWKEVFNTFKHIPIEKEYSLDWGSPNSEKLKELLCEQHDFSEERVESALDKLRGDKKPQKGLGDFM